MRDLTIFTKELDVFGPPEDVRDICLAILKHLASSPMDELRMLTYRTLVEVAGRNQVDEQLLMALNVLVSSRVEALDARALFVDEDDNEHELNTKEFAEVMRDGELIHPGYGEPVPDFESRLIPFFVPSKKFCNMAGTDHG